MPRSDHQLPAPMLYTRTASCMGSVGLSSTRVLDFDLERSVRERLRLRRDREDLDRVLRLLFSSPSSFIRSYSPSFRERERLRLRREDPERLFSERFLSFSEFIRRIIALKNRIERPSANTIESNLRTFFAISSGVFPNALPPCFVVVVEVVWTASGSMASSTQPA